MSAAHLTLRQLRAIHAVYQTGRIALAAERLSVSQSATSVLLKQAEEMLGSRLFDRTTRSIQPTEAVLQIIGPIERILGELKIIERTVSDIINVEQGHIRIATTPATGIALFPETVKRYKRTSPEVKLEVIDCAPNQLFDLVDREEVDFAVGIPPAPSKRLSSRCIHEDPLFVVFNRTHRFSEKQSITWEDLDGEPILASRRDYGVRSIVEGRMAKVGATINNVGEVGFLYSAEWMIACDMGLSVFPSKLAQAIVDPHVEIRPIVQPVVTRPLAIIHKQNRSLSPSAEQFVNMLTEDLNRDTTIP